MLIQLPSQMKWLHVRNGLMHLRQSFQYWRAKRKKKIEAMCQHRGWVYESYFLLLCISIHHPRIEAGRSIHLIQTSHHIIPQYTVKVFCELLFLCNDQCDQSLTYHLWKRLMMGRKKINLWKGVFTHIIWYFGLPMQATGNTWYIFYSIFMHFLN